MYAALHTHLPPPLMPTCVQASHQAIMRTAADHWPALWQNVILCGGIAAHEDFVDRLEGEVGVLCHACSIACMQLIY